VVLLIKAVYKNIKSEIKQAFYLRIRLSKNPTIIGKNFQI